MYCSPPATGPGDPELEERQHLRQRAAARRSSRTPVRTLTTRRPCSAARCASRSQITQTSARKSSPGGRLLVDRARRRAARSSRPRRRRRAPTGAGRRPRCRPRGCACRARASCGCGAWRRRTSVARRSRPRDGRRRRGRRAPRRGRAPARAASATAPAEEGLRDSVVTSSPRARRRSTSLLPMRPLAPVTVIFMSSVRGRVPVRSPRDAGQHAPGGGARRRMIDVTCQSSRFRT